MTQPITQKGKVYDIYMDQNIGATGTKRHLTNQLKHYSKPIIATNADTYIDQGSQYQTIHSIPIGSDLYELKDKLQTAVCVCIYNQDSQNVQNTLKGIHKNIPHLPTAKQYRDVDGQRREKKQIAVFIIQDGMMKCHPSIIKFLTPYEPIKYRSQIKTRQDIINYEIEAVKRKKREMNPTGGDDFPYSIPKRTSLMYEIDWRPDPQSEHSLKVFFVFKHLNGKKLSSHAWFFEGFCRYLKPQFCVLLDVGTVPHEKGIAKFVKQLKRNDRIGGVSGFMNIDASLSSEGISAKKPTTPAPSPPPPLNAENATQLSIKQTANKKIKQDKVPDQSCGQKCGKWFKDFFWSIEKAQACQYIMAHFLDKNFESILGFLHVLPGAWSAYRLSALQTGQIFEQDILQKKYFRTIINPDEKLGAQEMMKTSNMYLAEDRILSLAIFCQKQHNFILKYVPDARACTDPMKTQVDLSLQRRRWINSSLYAFEYVQNNYEFDMANSNHSPTRKFFMHFNIFMSSLNFFNSSLIPCFFLFILYSTIRYNGLIPNVQGDIIRKLLASIVSIPYIIIVIAAIGGSMIGNIWINDIYERDGNGDVIKQRVPGQSEPQPVKRSDKIPKQNGYAVYITVSILIYNYIWFIAVGVFTANLIKQASLKNFDFSLMKVSETVSVLFLFINVFFNVVLLLLHLPTHFRQVWELIKGFASSLSFLSLYTHTMVIFSVCNVDDISWGTKGSTSASNQSDFSNQKSYFVGGWILKNAVVCFILFMIDGYADSDERWITIIIASYSTIFYTIKCFVAIINQLRFLFCEWKCQCS